jgi:hypothetical protein
MGVKRFLVAGGMASLVLIGVLLGVHAKGLASTRSECMQGVRSCGEAVSQQTGVGYGDAQDAAQAARQRAQDADLQFQMGTRGTEETAGATGAGATGEQAGVGSGNPPPPQEEIAGIGMGNMGDQQAPSGGGAGGGTGGTGGGSGATVTITDLPETGGLSVVFLITSAILLGSGLLMVTVVRSIRS